MSNDSCDRRQQSLEGSNVDQKVKLALIFCKLCTASTHSVSSQRIMWVLKIIIEGNTSKMLNYDGKGSVQTCIISLLYLVNLLCPVIRQFVCKRPISQMPHLLCVCLFPYRKIHVLAMAWIKAVTPGSKPGIMPHWSHLCCLHECLGPFSSNIHNFERYMC